MIRRVLRSSSNSPRNALLLAGATSLYYLNQERFVLHSDSSSSKSQWPRSASTSGTQDVLANSTNNEQESTAWASFTSHFATAQSSISNIKWGALGDTIADAVLPEWAQALPGFFAKLQRELNMAPGSLADEIWQEAQDVDINPEIAWNASVRIGKTLCKEELIFRRLRKHHTARALAKYLHISEGDVDPDDVPTIAMCGSGGGLRALVAGASSFMCSQEEGLLDCTTYTAGVSGSCWLQTLFFSSLAERRYDKLLDHLKKRIGVHIAYPPTALGLLTTSPTNKFLLSGFLERLRGDTSANFGLVDIYGVLLASRLLVPRGELELDDRDLKISNQREHVDNGHYPLPIYTAVRHEIPLIETRSKEEKSRGGTSAATIEKAKQESWFQWFETTPYELWCEELDAGIPTFAIGRHFQDGNNILQENGLSLPELRTPFLMGIWGSAFCATLSHYYKEIRPLVKGLAGFGAINEMLEDNSTDLVKIHPIEPGTVPNYVSGLRDRLPATCPESVFRTEHLQLMDAGMSNNIGIYPLLRPGRDVDMLVVFDASADIKTENWLRVADGYAKQKSIRGWPLGCGWPNKDTPEDKLRAELEAATAKTAQEAATTIVNAREQHRVEESTTPKVTQSKEPINTATTDLSFCNVWVGTTVERSSTEEPPQSKRVNPDADWEVSAPNAGIAVVYFPFLANPNVEGVDPNTSDFMSTWNFIYTPEEIEKVVALARANFEEGKEQTRRTVRAVYERKRANRLKREEGKRVKRWRKQWHEHANHFQ